MIDASRKNYAQELLQNKALTIENEFLKRLNEELECKNIKEYRKKNSKDKFKYISYFKIF